MSKTIRITQEESVQIHNAIINSANYVMEEIVELEEWMKDKPIEETRPEELEMLKRRWNLLIGIIEKLTSEVL